jgi:hypothetical protein
MRVTVSLPVAQFALIQAQFREGVPADAAGIGTLDEDSTELFGSPYDSHEESAARALAAHPGSEVAV